MKRADAHPLLLRKHSNADIEEAVAESPLRSFSRYIGFCSSARRNHFQAIFLRFAKKASLHRKQGFFTVETRLLYNAKEPCLQNAYFFGLRCLLHLIIPVSFSRLFIFFSTSLYLRPLLSRHATLSRTTFPASVERLVMVLPTKRLTVTERLISGFVRKGFCMYAVMLQLPMR